MDAPDCQTDGNEARTRQQREGDRDATTLCEFHHAMHFLMKRAEAPAEFLSLVVDVNHFEELERTRECPTSALFLSATGIPER